MRASPSGLNNLANSVGRLYAETGDGRVLDEALDTYLRAVEHTAAGDPWLPSRLAALYEALYVASGNHDRDALDALVYYRANPNVEPFAHPFFSAAFYCTGV